jgi:hypothetical protein
MNAIMMTNAQFYFALSVPLVGILVNVVLFQVLNHRIDRVEDQLHTANERIQTGQELLIGKINEIDVRLARLEERSAR